MGAFEVAVSDTIGVATPGQVADMVDQLRTRVPAEAIALHLHDTRGTALANVLAALEAGITTFDASAGGLGGCPFAPGAAGNLSTEDLLYMLHGLGIETGVDLDAVVRASRLDRALRSATRCRRATCKPPTPRGRAERHRALTAVTYAAEPTFCLPEGAVGRAAQRPRTRLAARAGRAA